MTYLQQLVVKFQQLFQWWFGPNDMTAKSILIWGTFFLAFVFVAWAKRHKWVDDLFYVMEVFVITVLVMFVVYVWPLVLAVLTVITPFALVLYPIYRHTKRALVVSEIANRLNP